MAMMGNTVVWKPANTSSVPASVFMQILREAGLPDGVINLVMGGPNAGDVIFNHRDFAGIQFTGSTGVFQGMWKTIGEYSSTNPIPALWARPRQRLYHRTQECPS